MYFVQLNALLALAVLSSGCATKTGRWYPVVGIGWVAVNTNQPAAFTSTTLGLSGSPGQFNLGLSTFTHVTVPTNANVVIDLTK